MALFEAIRAVSRLLESAEKNTSDKNAWNL